MKNLRVWCHLGACEIPERFIPQGIVRKIYEKVDPNGHERVLLDDIKALQAQQAAA